MRDLLGEKTALDQTQKIIRQIDPAKLTKKLYKELVLKIYDNQLKKFTKYNRSERHKILKDLGSKANRGVTGVEKSPALLSQRALAKVLNENPRKNQAEQGSANNGKD